ncbi:MAG: hypothetical protein WC718_06015 [Phycisphaerales bacterium]|jgi:hypothetical protein
MQIAARVPRNILRRVRVAALLGACATSFIGCASAPPPPSVLPTRFASIPTRIVPSMGMHIVELQCPTPGYQATLTRSLDEHMGKGVYITIRQPDPGVNYAQRLVTQQVATDVPTTLTLNVYARLLPYDAPADSDEPFSIAGSEKGSIPIPTPP